MLSNISKMTQLMTGSSRDSNPNLSDLKTHVLNLSSVLNNLKIPAGRNTQGFCSVWELFDDTAWEKII